MESFVGLGELSVDAVVKTASKLKSENDALRDRAVQELSSAGRPMEVRDYFHAYKLIKEGRIEAAIYEMEMKMDRCASGPMGWRSWI